MRRSIALAAVAALIASVALVGVVAGGGFWKAPPFSSIGIYTVGDIDSAYVDEGTDGTVLSVFVETGSKSLTCLATPNEEANLNEDMPGLASMFCAHRSPIIDGVEHDGVYLHLFLDGPMGTGYFDVNVYQEGAKYYLSPAHCVWEGC